MTGCDPRPQLRAPIRRDYNLNRIAELQGSVLNVNDWPMPLSCFGDLAVTIIQANRAGGGIP
jgi:uncharacterized protein YacL